MRDDTSDGPIAVVVPDEGDERISEVIIKTVGGREYRYIGRERKTHGITRTDVIWFSDVDVL